MATTTPKNWPAPQDGGGVRRGKPNGRVERARRRHMIVQMTLAGATESEIAEALGVRASTVSKVLNRQLEVWQETDADAVERVRTTQLRRIDKLVSKLWPEAVGDAAAGKKPNLKAVAEIRNLESLRAKIVGTEAARKIEVGGNIGFTLDRGEIERAEQAWLNAGGDVIEGTAVEEGPGELPPAA